MQFALANYWSVCYDFVGNKCHYGHAHQGTPYTLVLWSNFVYHSVAFSRKEKQITLEIARVQSSQIHQIIEQPMH